MEKEFLTRKNIKVNITGDSFVLKLAYIDNWG